MKALEKTSHRAHLGELETQAPFQAGIAPQQLHILGAIAAGRLQQDHRFNVLGLVKTALALLELEMGGDETRDAQRAEGAGGGQQSGVRAGHLVQGPGVDFEGRLILSWDASRHGHNTDILSMFCQEKNALEMRYFRHFAKLRADQGPTNELSKLWALVYPMGLLESRCHTLRQRLEFPSNNS